MRWKMEKVYYNKHIWIISGIGILVLYEFNRNPKKFYLVLMLFLIILLLLYLVYTPLINCKRWRRTLENKKEYLLEINSDYIICGDEKNKICLSGNKIKLICAKLIYIIQIDKDIIGFPKRLLSPKEEQEMKFFLGKHQCQMIKIVAEKGRGEL